MDAGSPTVRTITRLLADVVETARVRIGRQRAVDPASQDVLVEVVRTLEQLLWMHRAQLRGRGN